jgi:hypothetical protein
MIRGRSKLLGLTLSGLTGLAGSLALALPVFAAKPIVHDGEYYFLERQYEEAWAKEDKEIDAKLAGLRKKHKGKPPNIVFVLIDDVSFGQMGKPAMNDVMGVQTPRACTQSLPARLPGPRHSQVAIRFAPVSRKLKSPWWVKALAPTR